MIRRSFTALLAAALVLPQISTLHAQSKSPVDSGSNSAPAAVAKAPQLKPFDLNTASEDDLVLVGMDRAVAKKVIAARPFKNKTELVSKKLLSDEQYRKVKDLLTAKQPPKPAAK
jgi:DNA uptake protein ComE-like DNA-binding protein